MKIRNFFIEIVCHFSPEWHIPHYWQCNITIVDKNVDVKYISIDGKNVKVSRNTLIVWIMIKILKSTGLIFLSAIAETSDCKKLLLF